ncbi:MAG: MFS transporter [Oligoflexales bacterium]
MNTNRPLRRFLRASYGVAEVGIIGVEVLLRVSLLIFYTDVVGLRSDLAGYAIALATLWDAVTDPFMGRLSDQKSIFNQRRRPYMMFGSFLLSFSVVFLFFPPHMDSQLSKCCYLLFSYVLVNTAMTIASVPYAAFAGDLTQEEHIRTELFGWRIVFGNLGFVAGTILPAVVGFMLRESEGQNHGTMDAYASVGLGFLVLFTMGWTLWMTSGLDVSSAGEKKFDFSLKSHWKDLTHVLEVRDFRWILGTYFVATIGLTLNSSLALYYYRYRLLLEEVNIRIILTVFMFVFSASIPFWVFVSKKIDKYKLIAVSIFLLGIMTCLAYPWFPIGDATMPLVSSFIGGVLVGAIVLLDVAVADIADQDRQGESSLGLYFGFWKFIGKISRAFALMATGHVLYWVGFTPNKVQPVDVSWSLAIAFGPGVGVFLLLSSFLAYYAFCYKK